MFPAVNWTSGQGGRILKSANCCVGEATAAARIAIVVAVSAAALLGQQKPAQQKPTQSTATAIEFPVLLRQKVAAGKTPVGTKVQAKLVIATLVKGKVIPEGAILSGEVTESRAKSVSLPSRLGLRMDSAQWRTGSVPLKIYLTGWYYPVAAPIPEPPSGPDTAETPTGSTVPTSRRRPRSTSRPNLDADPPPVSPPGISQYRALLKDVLPMRNHDGAVILTSRSSNLKLDKATTYVLAGDELLLPK